MKDLNLHFNQNNKKFGIEIYNDKVYYYGKNLYDIVEKYGSPIKIYNLEVITNRIKQAQKYFNDSIKKHNYTGIYTYCYCTKSNHFSFVINTVLKNNKQEKSIENVHLETSSDFDLDIILSLNINKDIFIIHNGFKPQNYINAIEKIQKKFKNSICVLDNEEEFDDLCNIIKDDYKIGIRMATSEKISSMKESRFGISLDKIIPFVKDKILTNQNFELKMLHFFISKGIKDTEKYYESLRIYVQKYCDIKKICPSLENLNIGGGLPIHFNLDSYYDYEKIIYNIIAVIKDICDKNNVTHPNIFTEFGSYTVGESALNIYQVLREKENNNGENWYIVDNSFITSIPDTWAIDQNFPVIPINNLGNNIKKVLLGGISCDKDDYLSGENNEKLSLPTFNKENPLYIAVLHTGAYQENLSGHSVGGLSHCQLDGEKILILNEKGEIEVFFDGEDKDERLKTLGYY